MNPKSILRALLLLFVAGSLVYMAVQEIAARRADPIAEPIAAVDGVTPDVIVYYFSVGKECSTCESIEAYTTETLKTHFADALATGKIQWKTIDMDKPEYEHFATDYNLYTKSIVFVALENGEHGRWKNLEKVWDYVYDKPAFTAYVRESLDAFLEPAP